jgi:putative two-component system response regulator
VVVPAQNPKILIIDDEPLNIDLLSGVLKSDYTIFATTNGNDGLALAHSAQPDLIILDIRMPDVDGYEVCHQLKSSPDTKEIPIVFCTTKDSDSDEAIGLQMGVVDYIHKPFNPSLVAMRVKNHIELHLYRKELESLVQERTRHLQILNNEIEQTLKETLFTLAEASEIRSKETGQHIKRVAHFTYLLAKHYGMNEKDCLTIKFASTMHDIGKLLIPDAILHKNGKLTEEECGMTPIS